MITFIVKYGMKLLIHSQISTAQLLKFGNGEVISFHIQLDMCLFIHAGIWLIVSGRVTHTCFSNLTIFVSDNGL